MAMSEQAITQQAPSLLIMTRYDGIQVVAQEEEKGSEVEVKKHTPRKLPKVLSPKMVEKLFAEINIKCSSGLRNRAMLEIMLRAGLRISEMCSLVPGNIDFDEKMIHVINGKGGVDRNIPIGPCLIEWLQKWDAIRPQRSEYFFCAVNKRTPILPRYVNQVLERLSERSGVYLQEGLEKMPVSNHKLRHTYACGLLREGFNLPEIQRLMGHKSINTTMVYLSVSMEDLKAKIEKMG